ncbi:hypothetical protein ACVJGC_004139 [Bradyrhizobium diazoefficiens]
MKACTASLNFETLRQQRIGRGRVHDVAAGQQRQRAEAGAARDEAATGKIRHRLDGVLDEQPLVNAGGQE